MIRGLFLDVFNQSVAASYLILAVMLARFLLKKAPKSVCCILWLLVGIRLIMPFSFVSAFSLVPSNTAGLADITEMAGGHAAAFSAAPVSDTNNIDKETAGAAVNHNNDITKAVNSPYVYFSIASVIWLAGIGIMLLYFAVSWFRIRKSVRMALPAEQEEIKYYQCEKIASPFLFGIFKTRIYVPFDLSGQALSYVLRHEVAHRQRKDYLIKPIGYLLLTVYWFHPLVWAAYILLCRDIELACDERVIRELGGEHKKEYALALLSCSVNHRSIAACPVAFGETGVKGRVKNVLNYKKPTLWVIIGAVVACVVIAVCFMTEKGETAAAGNGQQLLLVNNAKTQGTKNSLTALGQQSGGILNVELDDTEHVHDETDGGTYHNYETADYSEYVKQWAEAFCGRDGKTILEMTDEGAASGMEESLGLVWGVDDNNEPYAGFGWSSPWPWGGEGEPANYQIISVSDSAAVILYYAWVSDPHVTVWREELSYAVEDGSFKVTSQDIAFCEYICVADEFYKAYPDGVIDGTMMDYYAYNGAGEALNENAKNPNMAGAYAGLHQPDAAAINLLNILNNKHKVGVSIEYTNEEETEAVVTFTFLEDSSTAQVRMIKPYGEDSIWLPQTY